MLRDRRVIVQTEKKKVVRGGRAVKVLAGQPSVLLPGDCAASGTARKDGEANDCGGAGTRRNRERAKRLRMRHPVPRCAARLYRCISSSRSRRTKYVPPQPPSRLLPSLRGPLPTPLTSITERKRKRRKGIKPLSLHLPRAMQAPPLPARKPATHT